MPIKRHARWTRLGLAAVLVAVTGAGVATHATPASASGITFVYNLDASTHIKKLNQDVVIPRGTFTATIDLATGKLTGDITLPTATTTVSLAGLPAATAKFKTVEVKPVTGHINLSTFDVSATAVFNIKIPSVNPLGLPINVVGDRCHTSEPVHVTMSGHASFAGGTFTGTYTIPDFSSCSASTLAINALIPGPGNTFTAVATQRT
jgi:hypothetical protein